MGTYAPPIGPGTSFTDLVPGVASQTFGITVGNGYVVTFNPVDPANPGVLYLYDSSGNILLTMAVGGSYGFSTPGGTGFYFTGTKGARNASVIQPTINY